jgi:peptidoglycan hydrolase-like protein with peptidoglycan-binding domain
MIILIFFPPRFVVKILRQALNNLKINVTLFRFNNIIIYKNFLGGYFYMATIIAQIESSGGAASEINQILSALGYKTSAIDTFNNQTKTSVESFQIDYGLPVTGVVDSDTYAVLKNVYKTRVPQSQIATYQNAAQITDPTPQTPVLTSQPPYAAATDANQYAQPSLGVPTALGTAQYPVTAAVTTPVAVPAVTATPAIPNVELRLGSTGPYVRQLQEKLIYLGYLRGAADGIFGQSTLNAAKNFQYAHGLTPDGVIGAKTWTSLNYYGAGVPEGRSGETIVVKPTIRRGDTGAYVQELQQKLISLGYLSGLVDGVFGAATASALRQFQSANGLSADGVAGANTWAVLDNYSDGTRVNPVVTRPTLRQGDRGSYVVELQQKLAQLGFYAGTIDGKFGSGTAAAVRKLQTAYGLSVDGVAGAGTWSVITRLLG